MRKSRNTISTVSAFVCVVALAAQIASAQTAAQLQQLENLTPAQRSAILEALQQTPVAEQASVSDPVVVTPREVDSVVPPDRAPEIRDSYGSALALANSLQPFGYDLFAGEPTTFAPATDIPVPVDYTIGPGDTIEIQLFGGQSALYSLVVSRDGVLSFPEIGPVSVSGLKYGEMIDVLQRRIAEQLIGVKASISMGPLRSIRVFVLGEAYRPGSYTVSSLSTMTNALFVSGGVKTIGSLRHIELKRLGKTVTVLDLYDLLLRGDTSDDARLQPGDVIFIPTIGPTVGVGGDIRRPAIYELTSENSIGKVIDLAGGLLPTAFPQATQVERINAERERTIINVDLLEGFGLDYPIEAGDRVQVFSVLEKQEDVVTLSGHVYRPGAFQWRDGMRLTDLIGSLQDLKPRADTGYVLVRRDYPYGQEVTVISADLNKALLEAESAENTRLMPRDQIIVLGVDDFRSKFVMPLLDDLKQQASRARPAQIVAIGGRVRAPGQYPLESRMRVSDLIRAGAGLAESAYSVEAELSRFDANGGEARVTDHVKVDIARILAGDATADLLLSPHDVLNIKEIPLWKELESVEIVGEVRFPGRYPIQRGERLSSVLDRAGGVTDLAFPAGAIFLREELRLREEEQLDQLAERIESQIAAAAAAQESSSDIESARDTLLRQVRSTDATGRLVIDLPAVLDGAKNSDADVLLASGDRILVPRISQTVTVIGEVQHPTSHLFVASLDRNDYLERSGGMKSEADRRRIYIVHADGSVAPTGGSRFFRNRGDGEIYPGDTIVVPLDADRIGKLSLWTSVSTIIYNIGVAAAAVASF